MKQLSYQQLHELWLACQTNLSKNPASWEYNKQLVLLENEFLHRNIPLPNYNMRIIYYEDYVEYTDALIRWDPFIYLFLEHQSNEE